MLQMFLSTFFASPGEKKEAKKKDNTKTMAKRRLEDLAPLPQRAETNRGKKRKAGPPNSELTSDQSMSFVKDSEAREKLQKLQHKKPRIKTTQEIIGKQTKVYLGMGPTKLLVRKGKEGQRCLYCQLPYSKFDMEHEDKWVDCKSCNFPSHKSCMEHLLKCPCGAAAPRNK